MWQSLAKDGAGIGRGALEDGAASSACARSRRAFPAPTPTASTAAAVSSARRFISMPSSTGAFLATRPGAQPARLGRAVQQWTLSARLMKMPFLPRAKEAAMAPQLSVQHRMVEANRIRLHVAELGEGPAVVLCHGWPETWYSWRHQLAALAAAGFPALAPDMRGYGRSDRPQPLDAYTQPH